MRYILAIAAIIGLMILWIAVQYIWRSIFIGRTSNEDVLASRSDCGSCGCTTLCSKKELELNNNR